MAKRMKITVLAIAALLALSALSLFAVACDKAKPPEKEDDFPDIDVTQEFYVVDAEYVKAPDKLRYGVGEMFDMTGMILKITWNDGYVEEIEDGKGAIAVPAVIADDTLDVDIYFGGHSFTQPLEGVRRPVGIAVKTKPARTSYIIGETFKPNGMEVYTVDDDGEFMNKVYEFEYATEPLGESDKTVTITADGFTCACPVTVTNGIIVEAEYGDIAGVGEKVVSGRVVEYASGNSFVRNFKDGSTLTFEIKSDAAVQADLIFIGASSWTEEYNGGMPVKIKPMQANKLFSVTCNGNAVDIPDNCIFEGAETDTPSYKMFAMWSDIQLNKISLEVGVNTIVFTFKDTPYYNNDAKDENERGSPASPFYDQLMIISDGAKLSFPALEPAGIKITKSPNKTEYYSGEAFSAAGMEVSYINHKGKVLSVVSEYTVSPSGVLAAGDNFVTVTAGDFTTDVPITVTELVNTLSIEAEHAIMSSGAAQKATLSANIGAPGYEDGYVNSGVAGAYSNQAFIKEIRAGGTITFEIFSTEDRVAEIALVGTSTSDGVFALDEFFTATLNGDLVSLSGKSLRKKTGNFEPGETVIGSVQLKKGRNTFVLTIKQNSGGAFIDRLTVSAPTQAA